MTKHIQHAKTFALSMEARSSRLPNQILGAPDMFTVGWENELNCLVDYMGMPLSLSDAQYLIERARQHLQYPPQDLQLWQAQRRATARPRVLITSTSLLRYLQGDRSGA